MRRWDGEWSQVVWALVVMAGVLMLVVAATAQPLPPLERCEAEHLELRAALVEWQQRAVVAEAQLARGALAQQRVDFEMKAKTVAGAPDGSVFDWAQKAFVVPHQE